MTTNTKILITTKAEVWTFCARGQHEHCTGEAQLTRTGPRSKCGCDCHEHHDALAAPERGDDNEWYYIRWYEVDLEAYPQEPKFAIEQGETVLGVVLEEEIAKRVITEHNQHSALIAQRERLLRLLRPVTSPTACYCAVMGSEKCWHCEARELITTIEQDQIVTTTTGREG